MKHVKIDGNTFGINVEKSIDALMSNKLGEDESLVLMALLSDAGVDVPALMESKAKIRLTK